MPRKELLRRIVDALRGSDALAELRKYTFVPQWAVVAAVGVLREGKLLVAEADPSTRTIGRWVRAAGLLSGPSTGRETRSGATGPVTPYRFKAALGVDPRVTKQWDAPIFRSSSIRGTCGSLGRMPRPWAKSCGVTTFWGPAPSRQCACST